MQNRGLKQDTKHAHEVTQRHVQVLASLTRLRW